MLLVMDNGSFGIPDVPIQKAVYWIIRNLSENCTNIL